MTSIQACLIFLILVIASVMSLGYIEGDSYHPIPEGAQIVIDDPIVDKQMPQRRFDPAWRHIGLGKRSGNSQFAGHRWAGRS